MRIPRQIGLYIHLPWCVRKCPYCDFNSHTPKGPLPETAYVEALLRDMRYESERIGDRTISSIFFGGGTPSLFSGMAIGHILDGADRYFRLQPAAEITLEANPGATDASRFKHYLDAGINRLSLGFQSMDNTRLRRLGRIHNADESRQAYRQARGAGFDNINIDMMYGLPRQTVSQALDDLQQVINLQPEHISWYQLTIEPDTAFARRPPQLPDDDDSHVMQESGIELLQTGGFRRYEISAYSKPGRECQHNLNYWRFGDYLGLGAGAHGKLTSEDRIIRDSRVRHPGDYLQQAGSRYACQSAPVPATGLAFEYLLNRLRLTQAFPFDDMQDATGMTKTQFISIARQSIDKGLLHIRDNDCGHTQLGYQYVNEILLDFLPA